MHEKYGEKNGLAILAFPCNQFDEQEPDDEEAIKARVEKRWNVKFDMASKVEVNGENAHPLWKYLRFKDCGLWWFATNNISSNFTKFLVDRNGNVVMRFTPHEHPYVSEQIFYFAAVFSVYMKRTAFFVFYSIAGDSVSDM